MKRFWRIVAIALICGALTTPQMEARGRNDRGNSSTENRSSQSASRPNGGGNKASRPGGNSNSNAPKPGNNNSSNAPKPGNSGNNNSRPGNSNNAPAPGNNGSSNRPGNRNNAPAPGNNGNSNYRPGNGNGNSNNKPQKPSGNINAPGGNNNNHAGQPPHGNNNAPRPGNDHAARPSQPGHHAPSHNHPAPSHHHHINRPHCPPARPYYRPTPPPTFRPHSGCPVLRTILGISFGTSINLSIDYLNRNGYSVSGYGNDVVYLRNVSQLNYTWHDATLYYDAYGLTGSQFMYSTNYNSTTRYNNVYNTLYNQYGAPVSYNNTYSEMTATWWGYDGQYVSLEYRPIYTNNGQLRYFTILSFGR